MHDLGEGVVGDVPYTTKRSSPTLKLAFNELEHEMHLKMAIPWSVPPPITLNKGHQRIFKLCEHIEMFEWALHEISLGNKHAATPLRRCRKKVEEMLKDLLNDYNMKVIIENATLYFKRRIDLFKQITEETMS
jgi:5'-deoxynucleotidase YfbR-like HD superfamily hydrolase